MSSAPRIAIGGFQHETNTFAPARATYEDFERHDGWPGLTRGAEIFDTFPGRNLPIAGFMAAGQAAGYDLQPLIWCQAEPSSYVTEDAFERIAAQLCDGLAAMKDLDGVYLDLHGAMVCEHHEDGEGALLQRVRAVIGPDLPLVISLDLHANVTETMARESTAMTIFRTYPHIDMADTGARAQPLMAQILKGELTAKAYRKLPFIIPILGQYTGMEPNLSIFGTLTAPEEGVASLDFAPGFPPADIYECGPAAVAYGGDQSAVEQAADRLHDLVVGAEADFENRIFPPDEAVRMAMAVSADKPVVLADAQDNPGAGASSDTVGLLQALLDGGAQGAVMALLNDPETVAIAQEVGLGKTFQGKLGGKSGQPGQAPLPGRFVAEALGDGRFTCTGAMYRGIETQLGPMALLRIEHPEADVRVVVGSERFQCLDQAIYRHVGVEPTAQRILAVKSTVHFRADYAPIASEIIAVEAPGDNLCRVEQMDYRRLRPGVRLGNGGPAFVPLS